MSHSIASAAKPPSYEEKHDFPRLPSYDEYAPFPSNKLNPPKLVDDEWVPPEKDNTEERIEALMSYIKNSHYAGSRFDSSILRNTLYKWYDATKPQNDVLPYTITYAEHESNLSKWYMWIYLIADNAVYRMEIVDGIFPNTFVRNPLVLLHDTVPRNTMSQMTIDMLTALCETPVLFETRAEPEKILKSHMQRFEKVIRCLQPKSL